MTLHLYPAHICVTSLRQLTASFELPDIVYLAAMANSLLFKLFRPPVFTQLVSCRVGLLLYFLLVFRPVSLWLSHDSPVVRSGVSPVELRVLGEAGSGRDQTLLQRASFWDNQPLSNTLQERPALWYSGAYGRSGVKGNKKNDPTAQTLSDYTKHYISLQGGFLPNVFKVLSHRPAEFRAFFAYYNELMNKETGAYCSVPPLHVGYCMTCGTKSQRRC